MNKKKEKNRLVRLYSTSKTGFYYMFKKPKHSKSKKFSLLKYDPSIRARCLFKEK